jgi:glyoxylase-like metal-dependent hydrolase (beta-lactamase superfamily II)
MINKLSTINAGFFKLDGGAMFGVVPKSIWNKTNPADENNLCSWATRCLLIETENRKILVDTGIGNKQDESFFKHYFRSPYKDWDELLTEFGLTTNEITDVFITHFHFDHVGGAVTKEKNDFKLTFKNANYWIHSKQLEWALNPNNREKASFLSDNIDPILQSGKLKYYDIDNIDLNDIELIEVDGHTEKQVLPLISTPIGKFLFAGDLIPSSSHVPIAYVMSYDVRPLLTMKEKERILNQANKESWYIVLQHDPILECIQLIDTPKGIRVDKSFYLSELFNDCRI